MATDDITSTLPRLLSTVKHPGEFFATGAVDLPVIRAHVDGLGGLGLPIPLAQAKALARLATPPPPRPRPPPPLHPPPPWPPGGARRGTGPGRPPPPGSARTGRWKRSSTSCSSTSPEVSSSNIAT